MSDVTEAVETFARRINAAFEPVLHAAAEAAPIAAERLMGEVARQLRDVGAEHVVRPAVVDAAGRTGTPTSDSVPDAPKPAETLSGAKACGCVGKCPSMFKPCPECGAEVTSVAVDEALTTTYRPCGHIEADGGN